MSKTAVRNRAHKEKRSFYKQHAKAPETRPQARGPRAEAGARGAGRAGRASEWRASAMSDYLHRLFGAQQRNLRPSIEQAQQSWDARHPEDRSAKRVARYQQRREARERLEAQAAQHEQRAEQAL